MKPFSLKITAVLTVVFAPFTHAASSMQLSWQQIQAEHSGLAAYQANQSAAHAMLSDAKARRLPAVSVNGRWQNLDEELGVWMDVSALNPQAQPIYMPVQKKQYWDVELGARLPLFTGGAISAGVELTQAGIASATAEAELYEDQLFGDFVQRYFGVSLARKKADIHQQSLINLEQHLQRAIRMEQEGTLSKTQRLQAEVERDKAHRNFQQARDEAKLAVLAYQAMFASEPETPALQLRYVELPTAPAQKLTGKMLRHSAPLALVEAQGDMATAGLKMARAQFMPSVAAFTVVELVPEDLTELEPRWAAGVAFEWRLAGGNSRIAQLQRYQKLGLAAELKTQHMQQELNVLLQQTLFSIDSARSNYHALNTSIELAEQNLLLQKKAHEQGLKTALDAIDAELLVMSLELESQKSLFDYYVAFAQLCSLVGEPSSFFKLVEQFDSID